MEPLRPTPERRAVIPPIAADPCHKGEALGVLQNRLATVEEDAKGLVSQLSEMGFPPSCEADGATCAAPVLPYTLRPSSDPQLLAANYEHLVTRVCRTESAVQTLKLSLTRVQAECDLSHEQKVVVTERLATTSDAYDKEISRMGRELVTARKDLKEGQEERRRGVEELKQLQEAFDAANTEKSESTAMIEDLRATKAKLLRRVGELREEAGREASLRASLEESHATLLSRVQDMEDIVSGEQEEVKKLNMNCSQLKRECLRAREEAELERSLRLQAEDTVKKLTTRSDGVHSQLEALQEDKAYLMAEMNKLRTRYQDLIAQLDQTHKLVSDKQSTHGQLETENKRLYEGMKSAAAQNAQLIAQYEQKLEELRSDAVGKMQGEQHIKELSDQLRSESREKAQALTTSSQLEARITELEEKLTNVEGNLTDQSERHRVKVSELRDAVRTKEAEKERVLRDKDSLLDEVNSTVDQAVEERGRLQAQLAQREMDLQSAEQNRKQLEQEMTRLLERLAALEEQVAASGQIEKGMNEMMEQKNRLAYDKGRLQSRVEDLQREVETLANSQSDLSQLRKVTTAIENNYKKSQAELNNSRITIQRLESQMKHATVSGTRKEEDFRLAIAARDEAVKETQRLLEHIETTEGRERQRVSGLEQSLDDTRKDNKKVAATLDSIMTSHSQLQLTVEGLQLELGRRDAQISQLTANKADEQHKARQLQKELENLQSKFVSMETLEANELDPLRAALEQCKADNAKMAASLETVVRSNGTLQVSVETLSDEVEKKTFLLEQTQSARERDVAKHELALQTAEERIGKAKEQLGRDREKAAKRTSKDIIEVRRQLEDLLSKNGELSRANTELRHKVTEMEYEFREQKQKITAQRSQIEHMTRVRHKEDEALHSLQSVSEQLSDLEKSNSDYVRKNDKQAKLIQKFMTQMGSIQEELQGVAQTQAEMAGMLQIQEEQLQTERGNYNELQRKYKTCRKRESDLESLQHSTEQRLLDAGTESLEVSANLNDAQTWFKTKFDTLQNELTKSRYDREARCISYLTTDLNEALQEELIEARKSQAGLVSENFEQKLMLDGERKKTEDTAEKARQMIKASREIISRLADYAEVTQRETKSQMLGMRNQLESEKEYARVAEAKYRGLRESSLRHTELLMRELDTLKASYKPYNSLDSSG